jgi:aminotransferase
MPKGTFYTFPNIKGTGMTSYELAEFLIENAKVVTIPGNEFGDLGEGYLRASFVTSVEKIKEALERIAMALANKR